MKKLVKKYILTFTLSIICSFCFSQNCKPFAEGEDEFTMEKQTFYGNFFRGNHQSMLIDRAGVATYLIAKKDKNDKLSIALQCRYPGAIKIDHPEWFKTGVKFLIKLENEVLTFTTTRADSGLDKKRAVENLLSSRKDVTRFTVVYLEAPITKEQLLKIVNQKIEKIRYFVLLENNELSEDINPERERMNKLQNQFRCLAESLN